MSTISVDYKDSKKLLVAALKATFPTVKFSIKRHGGSVDVGWVNGPTQKEVQAVTQKFEGKHTDYTGDYVDPSYHEVEGQSYHYALGFIFVGRDFTEEFLEAVWSAYTEKFGISALGKPAITPPNDYHGARFDTREWDRSSEFWLDKFLAEFKMEESN